MLEPPSAQVECAGDFTLDTDSGQGMNRAERRTLASLRTDEDIEPTVELYRAMLLALRMATR